MNRYVKFLAVGLIIGFPSVILGACADKPIDVHVTSKPLPVLEPYVGPPTFRNVTWKAYNAKDLKELVARLDANPDEKFVLITLEPTGYQNLMTNLAEVKKYIASQDQKIVYYKSITTVTPDAAK